MKNLTDKFQRMMELQYLLSTKALNEAMVEFFTKGEDKDVLYRGIKKVYAKMWGYSCAPYYCDKKKEAESLVPYLSELQGKIPEVLIQEEEHPEWMTMQEAMRIASWAENLGYGLDIVNLNEVNFKADGFGDAWKKQNRCRYGMVRHYWDSSKDYLQYEYDMEEATFPKGKVKVVLSSWQRANKYYNGQRTLEVYFK